MNFSDCVFHWHFLEGKCKAEIRTVKQYRPKFHEFLRFCISLTFLRRQMQGRNPYSETIQTQVSWISQIVATLCISLTFPRRQLKVRNPYSNNNNISNNDNINAKKCQLPFSQMPHSSASFIEQCNPASRKSVDERYQDFGFINDK